MLDRLSLERIVPDLLDDRGATGRDTLEFHQERYSFAANHLVAGAVLDIACGVGYGTKFLADECSQLETATGVDIDPDVVDYARQRYGDARIEFIQSDATTFAPDRQYDNIVTLETLEHLRNPDLLFGNLVEMLSAGGVLVASVPVTPSMDGNPHHLSDFTERRLRNLGSRHGLTEIAAFRQIQEFNPVNVVGKAEERLTTRRNLPAFYARNPNKLALRMWSTLRYGFSNRYLTLAWRKGEY